MVFDVRKRQMECVVRMLHTHASGKDPVDSYKVLVLDKFGKDVIAPLLRVNDLRKHGVTLILSLENERQPVQDVPAIYLVQPTLENVERIAQDAERALYQIMHLNFTYTLPSRLVEQLATSTVKSGSVQRIAKLLDQYLAFIALESSLFSLGLPNSYVELNDPRAGDSQIEAAVSSIVEGLFSVCVTLGVVPIIRCPKGGAAEHVAGQLDQRIREAMKARSNLFSEGTVGLSASLSRPLLCLFDRNFDLSAALQHSWTYKAMVQDVLGLRLNRVVLAPEQPGPGPGSAAAAAAAAKGKTYDVDERDFFWEAAGSFTFPKMAEEVELRLKEYKAAVEEINKKAAAGQAQEGIYDPTEAMKASMKELMGTLLTLPEQQERKKVLDKHTNLATALLTQIKARSLDQYHTMGEDLLTGKADLAGLLKLLRGAKGTAEDKLRIAIIYLLSLDSLPPEADLAELEGALRDGGVDTTALSYVRTLKRNNLTGRAQAAAASVPAASSQANLLDWAGQGLTTVTKTLAFANKLLGGSRQAPMTTAMEALMDGKAGTPEYDTYAVFDPKLPAGRATVERAKGPFKEGIVFVIGGGSYMEREAVLSWAGRAAQAGGAPRQVVYGATDILSGEEFLRQLNELGRRCGIA